MEPHEFRAETVNKLAKLSPHDFIILIEAIAPEIQQIKHELDCFLRTARAVSCDTYHKRINIMEGKLSALRGLIETFNEALDESSHQLELSFIANKRAQR